MRQPRIWELFPTSIRVLIFNINHRIDVRNQVGKLGLTCANKRARHKGEWVAVTGELTIASACTECRTLGLQGRRRLPLPRRCPNSRRCTRSSFPHHLSLTRTRTQCRLHPSTAQRPHGDANKATVAYSVRFRPRRSGHL